MTATVPAAAAATTPTDPAALQVVDVDLHHQIANWQDVAPYAPEGPRL